MWRFAWLVVVPACTIAYGLDEPRDDDRDHDGIPDSRDNCPERPNIDQSDVDGNGIGDACDGCNSTSSADSDGDGIPDTCDGCDNRQPDFDGDGIPDVCEHPGTSDACPGCAPCAIGPLHDEDHDLLSDGCDMCPANPKDDGDIDGDGVGDECDPITTVAPSQQMFDSFLVPNTTWFVQGAWDWTPDSVTARPNGTVHVRQLGSLGKTFVITTHVAITPGNTGGLVRAGLYASVDSQAPATNDYVECYLDVDATVGAQGHLDTFQSGSSNNNAGFVSLDTGYTFTLTYLGDRVLCTIAGDTAMSMAFAGDIFLTGMVNGRLWLPGMYASGFGTARFDYFDSVTEEH